MGARIESVFTEYQAATSEQIRRWSYGAVKRRLRPFENPNDWRDVEGTIWDRHIFGTVADWECACGRYQGLEYSRFVCPICRVTVALSIGRRFRFGHVNLPIQIPHPFFAEAEPLDAVPVIPAIFWETSSGQPLAHAYEEVVHRSLVDPTAEDLVGAFGVVLAHVEKLFDETPEFEADVVERLARGMALVPRPPVREEPSEDAVYSVQELKLARDWEPPEATT